MPKILFVHTNFPAQFGFLGERLAKAGWEVAYATRRKEARHPLIRVVPFEESREITKGLHPYLSNTEAAVITGQRAAKTFIALKNQGYAPDIVMAHSGWGAGLFVRDVWPETVFVPYCEWWYRYPPIDSAFLGDLEPSPDTHLRQRVRNAPMLLDLEACDFALAPTEFQAAQFPPRLRALLKVVHDGVDTAVHAPATTRPERIGALDTAAMPEIVTYATRGMEPQRGFPSFMRALEILQDRRPGLHAIIVGTDRVAYGRQLPEGESWKQRMLAECTLDESRTHFTGHLGRSDYLKVLQVTDAHVYLTAPFVLSWSMLEAMSTACPLVGADVEPVREFLTHDETGLLTDFHDPNSIATAIEYMLDNPERARAYGMAARKLIRERYNLDTVFAAKRTMLEDALNARG
ncbi:MAG: glycosyltransferase [Pseudomonadota bacterium]